MAAGQQHLVIDGRRRSGAGADAGGDETSRASSLASVSVRPSCAAAVEAAAGAATGAAVSAATGAATGAVASTATGATTSAAMGAATGATTSATANATTGATTVRLSLVIPARNEAACLPNVVPEALAVLDDVAGGGELVVVDDASSDATAAVLEDWCRRDPRVVVVRLEPPATASASAGAAGARPIGGQYGNGQSAALRAGFAAARGQLVASMDGDGQNDPGDLLLLLQAMAETKADVVQGDRGPSRADGARRRWAAAVGRWARRVLLGDSVRDTGCSLRVMRREIARALPLDAPGMHRFVPVLAARAGAVIVERPVRHRPRLGGTSHYRVFGRAWPGLRGCLRVRRIVRSMPRRG